MSKSFKVGIIQAAGIGLQSATLHQPAYNKVSQLKWIFQNISSAFQSKSKENVDMIVLPEMWNTPYNSSYFEPYAESICPDASLYNPNLGTNKMDDAANNFVNILQDNFDNDQTLAQIKQLIQDHTKTGDTSDYITTFSLSCIARKFKTFMVAGSVTERAKDGKLYNTSPIFSPDGQLIYTYRKTHLFDMDVPGEVTFFESKVLSSGNSIGLFDHPKAKIGLAICRDIRYPELALLMKKGGSSIIVYPGCFNNYTGPRYWELLLKARAIDTNCFVIGCGGLAPQNNSYGDYMSYGHSMIVSPRGTTIADMGTESGFQSFELDLAEVEKCDKEIPLITSRRNDLYYLKTAEM